MKTTMVLFVVFGLLCQGCLSHRDNATSPLAPPGRIVSAFNRSLDDVRRAVKKVMMDNGVTPNNWRDSNLVRGETETRIVVIEITPVSVDFVQMKIEVHDKTGSPDTKMATILDLEIVKFLQKY